MSVIGIRRKENLRYLIDTQFDGVVQRLARRCEIQHSQIWRVLKDTPVKGQPRWVGEKLARRIEEHCELPEGWLDTDRSEAPEVDRLFIERLSRLSADELKCVKRFVQLLEESA